jgi:hypothetical protein
MVREDSGVAVMCSSSGLELPLEDPKLELGYFTQGLIEGLTGRADVNGDGSVTLTELDAYIFYRVKDLSNDKQHPLTARPASMNFPLSKF